MSQVIDLCEDSDDNGELPNTVLVPPPPLIRKRPRDNEESSNDSHPRNENGPRNKTATGSAAFVVDLELADEVEVPPHKKRRGVMKVERSAKNDPASDKCAQIPKGVHDTEKDSASEDVEVTDHLESHESMDAAASHPLNSEHSKETSRDDVSANKHSQKRSTTKQPPKASGKQRESLSADALSLSDGSRGNGVQATPDKLANETDLEKPTSKPATRQQAAKSPPLKKSAASGDSVDSNTRDDASQAKVPYLAHPQKTINSFSHALLGGGPQDNDLLVAAKKPASSKQGAELQEETALSNETLPTNPAAAKPLQQRHNLFTHALLLGDGSTGNSVQATPDEPESEDEPQAPQDEVFQSDNVLNAVELELIWLGEESMYCLSCPDFQFDFIYEYASPALKVELRKLSRDDQSETEKLKQIVRMDDWLVSRRFDFVRKGIRMMLGRGFRRQQMRMVIAELRLLRRKQSKRHFPAAMILDKSETAPAKAAAPSMIEQVDAKTLKVVATFPSQSEAERQTGVPRSSIHRGLRESRPVGGYLWNETAPAKASAPTMIEQVDANTLKVVATFPSQHEAERQTRVSRASIRRGLREGRPVAGYFWRSVRLSKS